MIGRAHLLAFGDFSRENPKADFIKVLGQRQFDVGALDRHDQIMNGITRPLEIEEHRIGHPPSIVISKFDVEIVGLACEKHLLVGDGLNHDRQIVRQRKPLFVETSDLIAMPIFECRITFPFLGKAMTAEVDQDILIHATGYDLTSSQSPQWHLACSPWLSSFLFWLFRETSGWVLDGILRESAVGLGLEHFQERFVLASQ